tara:strand:- start:33482 stop:35017 length:1536 start_codon:yes stop_codon:yes gene_type:complete
VSEEEQGGEVFSSRLGLVLAAIGAAVGTGNIWRFPREAAANGGGSFMIGWLLFLFLWSIPLLMAEFAIGKKTRLGTVGALRDMGGRRFTWMGMWMVFVSTAVAFYYAVVMGWTIRYFWVAFSGEISTATDTAATEALWNDFIGNPLEVIMYQLIAVTAAGTVVYFGIKGIETANKILLPTLVGFLVLTLIYPFYLDAGAASQGLRFLFIPQPEYLLKSETWIRALTQSAWSTSAGFGTAITYAVAMRKKEDVSLNAFLTGLGNNSVSLIAGVAVLGTVFALSDTTADGLAAVESGSSGLTFIHLTALFATAGGIGRFIGAIFFLSMSFAALTSLVSSIEVASRNFMDAGWKREEIVKYVTVAVAFAGLPAAASLHFLDNQDFVWGTGLLVSGLFVAFVVIQYGASDFRKEFINHEYSDLYIGKWWDFIIRYIFPLEFIVVFSSFLIEKWGQSGPSPIGGLDIGKFTILSLLIQWGAVISLMLYFNNKIASDIKSGPMSVAEDEPILDAEDV